MVVSYLRILQKFLQAKNLSSNLSGSSFGGEDAWPPASLPAGAIWGNAGGGEKCVP